MTPEQREAIRSAALYLRNLRPVDPAEVQEYVTGRPREAVVRQVLRDDAYQLGMRERPDGTFVPVPEKPVETPVRTVESFPDRYAMVLADLLVDRYGPDWPVDDSGDQLRATIRRLKEAYYRGRPVEYDADVSLAYAIYHLPDYYAAIQYVLADLVERRLLPRTLRVLDVGAGVGGPMLGLYDALPDDAVVDYHAIEPSAATDVLDAFLAATGRSFRGTIHQETAEAASPAGSFDLVLFANVLSELDDPVATAQRYVDSMTKDGSFVAIAPADRETSIGLRAVERAITDGLTVYSPTVRLWPGYEPTDTGWSFDVRSPLAVPSFQRRLDEAGGGTGEFVNVDVQYSYVILRSDGTRRIEFTPDPDRFARMADMERHVTERVDLVAIKLSHDLATDGNPLFKVGDGSEQVDHYAVVAKETAHNRDLIEAEYGDLLRFGQTLVLWNDDEDAYNLVVDGETVVDRLRP